MELIWPSAFVVQSIHVVARLGLADILGPEPRTIEELAKAACARAITKTRSPSANHRWRFCRGRRWAPSTYRAERDTADGPSGVCPRLGANARRALCVAPA